MTNTVTYQQAKEQGLIRYFTGAECRNGHVVERLTSTRACVQCVYDRQHTPEQRAKTKTRTLRFQSKEENRSPFRKLSKNLQMSHIGQWFKIGVDPRDVINKIEESFEDGMEWDNFGEWQVDHLVPKSWFDKQDQFSVESRIKICNQPWNLRAMWRESNIRKGDSVPEHLIQPTLQKLFIADGMEGSQMTPSPTK